MKIGRLQKFGLAVLDPLRSSKRLALRTVSIPAAVEAIPLMTTLIASLEVAAQAAVRHSSIADMTRRCAVDIDAPCCSR
jgi:hypothetical protein